MRLLLARIYLLILTLILCGYAFAELQQPAPRPFVLSQNKQPHTNETDRNPTYYQSDPAYLSPGKNRIESEKSTSSSAQERKDTNEETPDDRSFDIWNVVTSCATVALAFITGALAIFTFKLWDETKKSSDRQAEEIRKIERAYVHLQRFEQNITYSEDKSDIWVTRFILRPLWSNCGNTPTEKTNLWASFEIHNGSLSYGFVYNSSSSQLFFLAPKAVEGSDFIEIPVKAVNDAIKSSIEENNIDERQFIYIYGEVSYMDIFNKNILHYTCFCHRIHFIVKDRKNICAHFIQWGPNNKTYDIEYRY